METKSRTKLHTRLHRLERLDKSFYFRKILFREIFFERFSLRDFLREIFFERFFFKRFFFERFFKRFYFTDFFFLLNFSSRSFLQEIFFKSFRRFLQILPWWTSWNLVSSYTKNVRSINAFFCYHGSSQVQQKEKKNSFLIANIILAS